MFYISKFKENLYYLTAINYFINGEERIDLYDYTILVCDSKETIYDSSEKALALTVGIAKTSDLQKEETKNLLYYLTVFFKKTDKSLDDIMSMNIKEKSEFIFKSEKLIRTIPYLDYSYSNIALLQSMTPGLPVFEDNLSCMDPDNEVQKEVAIYVKTELKKLHNCGLLNKRQVKILEKS